MKSLAHSPAHSRLLIKGSFLLPPILSSQTVCVSESNYFKIPGFLNRCSWECHGIGGILHPLVENPATKLTTWEEKFRCKGHSHCVLGSRARRCLEVVSPPPFPQKQLCCFLFQEEKSPNRDLPSSSTAAWPVSPSALERWRVRR